MLRFENSTIRNAWLGIVFTVAFALVAHASQWIALGPDGGDVRKVAYDPHNPDRILMGTMAGKLFVSTDGGSSWTRLAHLGSGNDYVLDQISFDPQDTNNIYVAAWSVEDNDGGDLFRSHDGGNSWQTLEAMHGKSLRALALAASNSKILVAGGLHGVYRSNDGGETWKSISPPEIKNVESVAVDPINPDVIYAGTWHLPWKTTDGGATWQSIKKGLIDDSDVFSIIIDQRNPAVVYTSACSGIYKSENGAELYHKIQGMPFSARRTRVLAMDPENSQIVYAGTTEGLWKTVDGGKNFVRMTGPNVVVNDVMIDPRHTSHVLLATDRGGVLVSNDAGNTFTPSNRGFAHRQVAALVVDHEDSQTLYAGLLNDKEFGGVFVSHDSGSHWEQASSGLAGRDVFSLRQTESGALLAGTNRGIFELRRNTTIWEPASTVISEKVIAPARRKTAKHAAVPARIVVKRSELSAKVADLAVSDAAWFAASDVGLFSSRDGGQTWRGGAEAGQSDFVAVRMRQQTVAAASRKGAVVSLDGGRHFYAASLPSFMTAAHDIAIAPDQALWLASREGVFRSDDNGDHWEHVLNGLPATEVNSISYDDENQRLLATSGHSAAVYESTDGGRKWHPAGDYVGAVRGVTAARGRMFVTTAYDGILMQSEREHASTGLMASGDGGSSRSSSPRK